MQPDAEFLDDYTDRAKRYSKAMETMMGRDAKEERAAIEFDISTLLKKKTKRPQIAGDIDKLVRELRSLI